MNIVYLKALIKDVKKIKDSKEKELILRIIEELKNTNSLQEIQSEKKLKGYDTAYRMRIENYRLGIFL